MTTPTARPSLAARRVLVGGLQGVAAVVSVVLGWISVHTVYLLRYARLYYSPPLGGIDAGLLGRSMVEAIGLVPPCARESQTRRR